MTIDCSAADYCPCCGQPRERPNEFERDGLTLRGHMLSFGEKRERLRPGVAVLTRALMERGSASREFLQLRVAPESDSNLVHVYACMLRKQLAELTGGAVVLSTIHSWGYEIGRAHELRAAA